ncbi:collagen binding domain-containing protein [Kitasatospora sp. NPDC051170]|uniref:collagen binding domain-containing protein n=1 Tax=Kitasatospora sp. NPDC051170 TaxID=3364056 RepID=UPI0037ABD7EC
MTSGLLRARRLWAGVVARALPYRRRPSADGHSSIDGLVTGTHGAPLADAVLTVVDGVGRELARSRSGRHGGCRLPVPGPGDYLVVAAARGHQPRALSVTVAERCTELSLCLTASSSIAGVVEDDTLRMPLADAQVVLTDVDGSVVGSRITSVDGTYSFPGVPPASYTLAVTHDRHTPAAREVTVTAECRTAAVDVALAHRLLQLDGTVRDRHDAPVAGARVTLTDRGRLAREMYSDAAGRFHFQSLPIGQYRLTVVGLLGEWAELEVTLHRDRHQLDLRLDQT